MSPSACSAASATCPSHWSSALTAFHRAWRLKLPPLADGGGGMLDRSLVMFCHIWSRMAARSPPMSGGIGLSTLSSVASASTSR